MDSRVQLNVLAAVTYCILSESAVRMLRCDIFRKTRPLGLRMHAETASSHPESADLVRLSDRLIAALRGVIGSSPLRGLGPIELARSLDIDKSLASRLMVALRAPDSLTALSQLPGTVPLRQFIRAVRDHGADGRAIEAAERELRAFAQELQRTFGTRTALDAAIADALPQARQKQHESARQAVFRGLSLIKGISIDLVSITWLVHPSRERPGLVDSAVLAAFVGVRRLRPTARIRFGSAHERTGGGGAALLEQFCRPAGLSITPSREHDFSFYEIATGPIRRDAAADVFLTEFLPGMGGNSGPGRSERPLTFGDAVEHPYKRLALNMLVHEEVWPGCDFSVLAYDTTLRGVVRPPDPSRESDRLPLDAAVVQTRATAAVLRSSPVPNFATILGHLAAPRGWDLERSPWRLFTVEVPYPLYGSQVQLVLNGVDTIAAGLSGTPLAPQ